MSLSPYPAYKDSGLPWLGQVPEHWEEKRGKYLFREVDERSTTGEEELLSISHITGVTPRSQKNVTMFKAESYVGHKLARQNDIVINTMWAWMAALGVSKYTGIVSPSYGVYRPHNGQDFVPEYVDYLLRTPLMKWEYICRSTGVRSSRLRLYPDKFLDIAFPCPPWEEQERMATFLRAKETQIRRLIRNKRRLIALLNEQKQAIINHAVTQGLNPNAPMKPTGIDWMPEIPAHWEVQRLKNVADVVLGKMLTTEAKRDGEFKPYLRSTNIQWIKPDIHDVKEMWISYSEMPQLRVQENDLLVSEGGEVGRACLWSVELPECYIQNSVHRVTAKPTMLPEFLLHQFFIYGKQGRFSAIVNRVSIAHLTREKLVIIPFVVPPSSEQVTICQWITDSCMPLDEAIQRSEDEIRLIREYHERLIADIVTGKLDVRDVAVTLPDIDEVLEDLEEEIADECLGEDAEPEDVEE
ncbi:MAG: restriction endonuclease subunit S [Magnetococcus sp. XQGC-1]